MNILRTEIDSPRRAFALGVWENEGGALPSATMDHQYGRRVEGDRSWTIYHVFTGVPARIDGEAMTGLSRADATCGMLSLNLRSLARRKERVATRPAVVRAPTDAGCQS
ncbi:hypothetical protein NOF55_16570 [Rhizobiaceae bacterium BDR2-2]|uniref:Uncharacterized protein n=1 Tax=Ectorhizobium quercum TaxID=2965071 RepID=A0AAE3N2Y8_9HYPH|nr:hypothetical protein [Ectorhizobium quercum]MCX8996232.1 hypothetical protein [Ectorhizobium quercum]MCX8998729.1 hypothetical protein [Ectorhizobium quercum]